MRRATVIVLAVPTIVAGGCGSQDAPFEPATALPGTTNAVVVSPMAVDPRTPDRSGPEGDVSATTPSRSELADVVPSEGDDAGGESIGVTDEVSIVILDPDD
jgi:hypothetical protein